MTIEQVQFTDARWLQFWENFEGQEHQVKSIIKLGRQIKQADPCLLVESADWVSDWRDAGDIENSWAGIEAAARKYLCRYPELVAAQWRLESGAGKHMSGRNNPFGLKGPIFCSYWSKLNSSKLWKYFTSFSILCWLLSNEKI